MESMIVPIKDHVVQSEDSYIERYSDFNIFNGQHEMVDLENFHLTIFQISDFPFVPFVRQETLKPAAKPSQRRPSPLQLELRLPC